MLVMCGVLSPFVWANVQDRPGTDVYCTTLGGKPARRQTYVVQGGRRGFPYTYRRIEGRDVPIWNAAGTAVARTEVVPRVIVEPIALVSNLAITLVVSVALALASERFIFSRRRRGRETREERRA
jgi:hypothetical protein